jgi:hypothetical protein
MTEPDAIAAFEALDVTGQALLLRLRDAWRGAAMNLFLEPVRTNRVRTDSVG